DGQFTRECGRSVGSGKTDVGIGGRTDTGRIAQSHFLCRALQIKNYLALVVTDRSSHIQRTASSPGAEGFDLEVVFVKCQRSIQVTQASGQIVIGKRGIRDLDLAAEHWGGYDAGDIDSHGHVSG